MLCAVKPCGMSQKLAHWKLDRFRRSSSFAVQNQVASAKAEMSERRGIFFPTSENQRDMAAN